MLVAYQDISDIPRYQDFTVSQLFTDIYRLHSIHVSVPKYLTY